MILCTVVELKNENVLILAPFSYLFLNTWFGLFGSISHCFAFVVVYFYLASAKDGHLSSYGG